MNILEICYNAFSYCQSLGSTASKFSQIQSWKRHTKMSSMVPLFMCLLSSCISSLENHWVAVFCCGGYWVVGAVCIFWKLNPCWSHHLQISSLKQKIFLYWDHWIPICKRMKWDSYLTPYSRLAQNGPKAYI